MTFPELVRIYRELNGISLAEAGRRIGTTRFHLWDIEHNRYPNPTLHTVLNICRGLNIPPEALFTVNTAKRLP